MEFFTLDSNLLPNAVVEGYKSFIWTERWSEVGDFQAVFPYSDAVRAFWDPIANPNQLIGCDRSYRLMIVETVLDAYDQNTNERLLTVSGQSIEMQMDNMKSWSILAGGFATTPNWTIIDTPENVVYYLFNQANYNTIHSSGYAFLSAEGDTLIGHGTIPFDTTTLEAILSPKSLYGHIKPICDKYNMGFRVVKDPNNPVLYFEVYTGDDRTTAQTTFPAVVFSENLDNLSGMTQLTSTANLKTEAWVISVNGGATVYGIGYDPAGQVFDKRQLYVDATDVTLPVGDELNAVLQQRGLEALSQCQTIYAFDGQIALNAFTYGTDYNLGDIVEERNTTGFGNKMRVTEQIFVSDDQGEREYPTLVSISTTTPGTWDSWDAHMTWAQVPSIDHWANV